MSHVVLEDGELPPLRVFGIKGALDGQGIGMSSWRNLAEHTYPARKAPKSRTPEGKRGEAGLLGEGGIRSAWLVLFRGKD